jgi:hypothetical protein
MAHLRPLFQILCATLLLQSGALQADWRAAVPEARKIGAGELRILGFSIYSAQFWSSPQAVEESLGMNAPFALELTYRRAISREDLVAASLREIRRLASVSPDPAQLQRWEREMHRAFVDVRAGDRITGVFLPGEGAHFYAGTSLTHVVRDEAFARTFFAIWLDPRTRNPALRAQLLGAAQP